jgi:hypothetical protein
MTYQIESESDLIKAMKEYKDGDTFNFWMHDENLKVN